MSIRFYGEAPCGLRAATRWIATSRASRMPFSAEATMQKVSSPTPYALFTGSAGTYWGLQRWTAKPAILCKPVVSSLKLIQCIHIHVTPERSVGRQPEVVPLVHSQPLMPCLHGLTQFVCAANSCDLRKFLEVAVLCCSQEERERACTR